MGEVAVIAGGFFFDHQKLIQQNTHQQEEFSWAETANTNLFFYFTTLFRIKLSSGSSGEEIVVAGGFSFENQVMIPEAHPARIPIRKKNPGERKPLTLILFFYPCNLIHNLCGSNLQVVLHVNKLLLLVVFPLTIRWWSQKLIQQEYPSVTRVQVSRNC